jgi:hypothetical protein
MVGMIGSISDNWGNIIVVSGSIGTILTPFPFSIS